VIDFSDARVSRPLARKLGQVASPFVNGALAKTIRGESESAICPFRRMADRARFVLQFGFAQRHCDFGIGEIAATVGVV
jgi:hypothetical protein